MIPIIFPTIMESMLKQLPQLDFTFGIGDIVGSIALLVSAFTFFISHTQASQSEQIMTSRDIWARIIEKFEELEKKAEEFRERKRREYEEQRAQQKFDEFEKAGEGTNEFKGPPPFRPEFSRAATPVLMEINYFAYLILSGEIKDKVVLGYYKEQLTMLIEALLRSSDQTDLRKDWSRVFPHFGILIDNWKIGIPK